MPAIAEAPVPAEQKNRRDSIARVSAAILALSAAGAIEPAAGAEVSAHNNPTLETTDSSLRTLFTDAEHLADALDSRHIKVHGRFVVLSYQDGQKGGQKLYDQLVLKKSKGETIPDEVLMVFGAHSKNYDSKDIPESGIVIVRHVNQQDNAYTMDVLNTKAGSDNSISLPVRPPTGHALARVQNAYYGFVKNARAFIDLAAGPFSI